MAEAGLQGRPGGLRYTSAELLAEHDYAQPHEAAGLRLHGGLDAQGQYVSPRTLHRWDAIRGWQAQLQTRGFPLIDATTDLLAVDAYPNEAQARLLIRAGLGQSFWDSLSITGIIEARGQALAEFVAPDFAEVLIEDITETGLGHLNVGLLKAHGWDEGGRKDLGIGGHDDMWFAVRDLLFGAGCWPVPEAPASISRDVAEREMPVLPEMHEAVLKLLMNVLMIEVRAERAFRFYENVIATPDLFEIAVADRDLALELVDRIRTDEAIHVAYLQTVISEFRSLTVLAADGAHCRGADLLDPVWEKMVRWHSVDMHVANRPAQQAKLEGWIRAEGGEELLAEFRHLATDDLPGESD